MAAAGVIAHRARVARVWREGVQPAAAMNRESNVEGTRERLNQRVSDLLCCRPCGFARCRRVETEHHPPAMRRFGTTRLGHAIGALSAMARADAAAVCTIDWTRLRS
jgi:hypothetical protein